MICPQRNSDLFAGKKSNRRTNAMNAGLVWKVCAQKQTQPFLSAASQSDDDLRRPLVLEQLQQSVIGDGATLVLGCDVRLVFIAQNPLLFQPFESPNG